MSGLERVTVGVSFDQWGRAGEYGVDPARVLTHTGSLVVVESARGLRLGRVTTPARAGVSGGRIRRVIRLASDKDLAAQEAALGKEPEAFRLALVAIRARRLPIKILRVLLDGVAGRATYFVASPDTIETGDLAAVLGDQLGFNVEIRQLGMRDIARRVGGVGRCGQELCCSTFLAEYPRTSIRMAKDQNMALADDRAAGVCGRTLCCLAYEHELYKSQRSWLPKLGKRARTSDGQLDGKVIGVDALRLTFTLLDDQHRRHTVQARAWDRNADKQVPDPEVGAPTARDLHQDHDA